MEGICVLLSDFQSADNLVIVGKKNVHPDIIPLIEGTFHECCILRNAIKRHLSNLAQYQDDLQLDYYKEEQEIGVKVKE